MSVAGTLGRYTVLRLLAKGGMADLLLARSTGMGGFERHVVIKRLREEEASDARFVEMFVTEARLAGQLHHHNIIQVQDIGEEGGRPYFAMEYIHGEDLRKVLRKLRDRGEVAPVSHIVAILSAAATALHHAHEQRGADRSPLDIVHRDVSPSNILVGYDGNVKVLDFGIAKAATQTVETQSGTLKGKVPYMSPEQCTNRVVDRRSDVFSLGIVAYELCTVRRLFKGDTHFLTMTAIVHGTLPRPSQFRKDLPVALEKIILKALARDPEARFQTAEEMRVALEAWAARAGIAANASGLAAYMKQLFGAQPEPWRAEPGDAESEVLSEIDFDGQLEGLAEPPTEVDQISIPEDSPLKRAHQRATTSSPVAAAAPPPAPAPVAKAAPPPVTKAALPPPARKPLATAVTPPPEQASVAGTIQADGDSTTMITTPPPMPAVVVKRQTDPTMIVAPLDPPEDTRVTEGRHSQRRWMYGGLVGAAAIAIAIAVVIGFTPSPAQPKPAEPIDLSAKPVVAPPPADPPADPPPPPPPVTPEPKPEAKPEAKPEPPPEPKPEPKPEPVAATTPEPVPAPEIDMPAPPPPPKAVPPKAAPPKAAPPVKVVRTPPRTAPPKVVKAPPPKTPSPPPLPPPPPKWDPDALFPKKKP